MAKLLPTMWETRVWSLGGEDPLEKEMATHSSTLAWKIPWEKPGRPQSVGLQSWTLLSDFTSIHATQWRWISESYQRWKHWLLILYFWNGRSWKKSTISLKLWWQNQYHSQRVRAPAVALRLIILPFQAGRMCLPLLNVAKHPQPSYSERCCQGMAAVADWHSISVSSE